MARFGTVKMSSIGALQGSPLNPHYLLNIKERLDARDAEETPENFREEAAAMYFEAQDRIANAKRLSEESQRLAEQARAEREEAESLCNTSAQTIARRMGI
jgi:hypothetical protein